MSRMYYFLMDGEKPSTWKYFFILHENIFSLQQRSANYGTLPIFVSKVLLSYSYAHIYVYVLPMAAFSTMAELSSRDRSRVAAKSLQDLLSTPL